MRIESSIERLPGGMMVLPLVAGALIDTVAPNTAQFFGSFTGALFHGSLPILAVFYVCMGSRISIASLPSVARRGGALLGAKVLLAILAGLLIFRAQRGDFDLVVAMYHDQGHGPVKILGLEAGVNITIGLPVVCTSVDHGTAFDIAGKGTADERSLTQAMLAAIQLAPGSDSSVQSRWRDTIQLNRVCRRSA